MRQLGYRWCGFCGALGAKEGATSAAARELAVSLVDSSCPIDCSSVCCSWRRHTHRQAACCRTSLAKYCHAACHVRLQTGVPRAWVRLKGNVLPGKGDGELCYTNIAASCTQHQGDLASPSHLATITINLPRQCPCPGKKMNETSKPHTVHPTLAQASTPPPTRLQPLALRCQADNIYLLLRQLISLQKSGP